MVHTFLFFQLTPQLAGSEQTKKHPRFTSTGSWGRFYETVSAEILRIKPYLVGFKLVAMT
jgi:hypothetical protein